MLHATLHHTRLSRRPPAPRSRILPMASAHTHQTRVRQGRSKQPHSYSCTRTTAVRLQHSAAQHSIGMRRGAWRWSWVPRMRTHAALACSGRSAVLVRRVQARSGGSAPRRADPTAPYLPSSADSAARQIWRMSPAHQASTAGLPCTRRVGSDAGQRAQAVGACAHHAGACCAHGFLTASICCPRWQHHSSSSTAPGLRRTQKS